ncbi:ABC transporter ATP-binding protein [Roseiarcaceae bacterium H3SJ34-1]|uniref:ABC transporter ATP-binding protein n=1 Tax=Terripilifer ovatus TaxID=3032367 RepID=UPI003AB98AF0|nr:ABC transporter ATP-binding protein [Roseiarcaceae bacterium H3SJ34-1]
MVALEVAGLRKSYNRAGVLTTALENVSFNIPDRQFISIVGPSGCGKSTLLRCIAGLAEPSGGDIRVGGQAMHGVPDDMVYVFQEYNRSLFPWRRLLGNVAYPIESRLPRSVSSDRARAYIKLVGLEGFENYYPWELSGGMQQRAAIARALVTEPKFLLMDEPFGALDAQTRVSLEETILDLWSRSPRTVIFVTHDIDEAIFLSDRVLVMASRPGRIVEDIMIDLPRPRHQIETKEDRAFSDYRRLLFGLIAPPSASTLS